MYRSKDAIKNHPVSKREILQCVFSSSSFGLCLFSNIVCSQAKEPLNFLFLQILYPIDCF